MKAAKQRNTTPELALQAALSELGLTYMIDCNPITGLRRRADVLFEAEKVAVFVDGCFWHGCPIHGTWPKANAEFWRDKIDTNRLRDANTDYKFAEAGWSVLRVWEHEDPKEAAKRILEVVSDRRK